MPVSRSISARIRSARLPEGAARWAVVAIIAGCAVAGVGAMVTRPAPVAVAAPAVAAVVKPPAPASRPIAFEPPPRLPTIPIDLPPIVEPAPPTPPPPVPVPADPRNADPEWRDLQQTFAVSDPETAVTVFVLYIEGKGKHAGEVRAMLEYKLDALWWRRILDLVTIRDGQIARARSLDADALRAPDPATKGRLNAEADACRRHAEAAARALRQMQWTGPGAPPVDDQGLAAARARRDGVLYRTWATEVKDSIARKSVVPWRGRN